MHTVLGGDGMNRRDALQDSESDLGFEPGTRQTTFLRHGTWLILDQCHPLCPVLGSTSEADGKSLCSAIRQSVVGEFHLLLPIVKVEPRAAERRVSPVDRLFPAAGALRAGGVLFARAVLIRLVILALVLWVGSARAQDVIVIAPEELGRAPTTGRITMLVDRSAEQGWGSVTPVLRAAALQAYEANTGYAPACLLYTSDAADE